jgi:hypothetical protein
LTDERGVREHEITLLSGRAPENKDSVLSGLDTIAGLKITKLTSDRLKEASATTDGEIGLATIASFKGLESKVVIEFNLSEYNLPPEHPIMSSLLYVAMTRAKHMLYVLVKEDDAKDHAMRRMESAVTRGGSMVLSAEERVGQRSGVVVHFNPERAGVISIDSASGAGQESVLMFGPDLRRAGIGSLKRGDKLMFRVRTEGGVAFAVDIKRDAVANGA